MRRKYWYIKAIRTAAPMNSSLYLDGVNDNVRVGHSAALNFSTGNFAIATAFNPLRYTSGAVRVMSKGNSNGFAICITDLSAGSGNGFLGAFLKVGNVNYFMVTNIAVSTVYGSEKKVILQRVGNSGNVVLSDYEMYVDGVLAPWNTAKSFAGTMPSAVVDESTDLYIGQAATGSSITQLVSEAGFLNRAMSVDEIAAWQVGEFPNDAKVYFKLDNTSGTTVTSLTPGGLTGNLNGYTSAETAAATQSVWMPGESQMVFALGETFKSKTMLQNKSFTRVAIKNWGASVGTATYEVKDVDDNVLGSGSLTFDSTGIAPCSISAVSSNKVEITLSAAKTTYMPLVLL